MATAVLLAAAGLLVACSSTEQASGTEREAALPGLSDSVVKVGYAIVDGDALGATLGFDVPDQGDVALQTKVIKAYVDFANGSGGAGGRQIVPVIHTYSAASASPEQEKALCDTFARDKVFAAVLVGQDGEDVLPCYRAANTLMVDESAVPHDQAEFQENDPYLWSPTHPEYSAFLATQLRIMKDQGFFDGATGVELIPANDEVSRRATSDVVLPYLASIGIQNTQINSVDTSNSGTIGAAAEVALGAGSSGGFDRVVAIGGEGIVPFALSDESAESYWSVWGVSTWDDPALLAANGDAVVIDREVGMKGLGYSPAFDLAPEIGGAFPDPTRRPEVTCKAVLDSAGIRPGDANRDNYRTAFEYCDATLFLKAALDKAPDGGVMTAGQFKDAVARIGSAYSSSLTFGGEFKPGQYAATNVGRLLTYSLSCACFTYEGDDVPISAN